jgi:hypothetical protein
VSTIAKNPQRSCVQRGRITEVKIKRGARRARDTTAENGSATRNILEGEMRA